MILLSLALAVAPSPAPTLAALQPPAQARAPAENRFYAFLRQRGVSPAGISIISRVDAANGAEGSRLQSNLQAANREVAAIVDAPQLDVSRLTEALNRRDAILGQRRAFSTRSLLEALRTMSPADRAIVIRHVGLPSARQPAQPQARQ